VLEVLPRDQRLQNQTPTARQTKQPTP
jgi:hypothetical protein